MNRLSNRTGLSGLRRARLGCWCVVLLAPASPAGAKTIEAVEKELVQKHDRTKSYTARMETTYDMDLGQGNRMKSQSKGTMEWLRRGPKCLFRTETKGATSNLISGNETTSKMLWTTVCDGDFVYALVDTDGRKTATKTRAQPAQTYDVKSTFNTWREDYTLKLLGDEKFDGTDCYVIQATPKKKNAHNPIGKQKFWFRKDLGMMVKMVGFGRNNQPAMTSTTTDVKLNVDIKPDRFKFKLPEGVQLMDLTKTQAQPAPSREPDDSEARSQEESDGPEDQGPDHREPAARKKDKGKGLKGLFDKALK